ncbi:MAG: hypothetical protein IJ538_02965 [Clostridia bacterium]|nr:hypothetical protein [Clostridia bacterium]
MFEAVKEKYISFENKLPKIVRENKSYIVLAIVATLLMLSIFWWPMYIFAIILMSIYFVFSDLSGIVGGLFLSACFSRVRVFFVSMTILGSIAILGHYIYDVIRKKQKVYVLPLAVTCFMALLFIVASSGYDFMGSLIGLEMLGIMFLIYIVFCYRKELNLPRIYKLLVFSIALSAFMFLFIYLFPKYRINLIYDDGTNWRFQYFSNNPNRMAILCIFALSYYIYKLIHQQGKFVANVLIIIALVVAGCLTMSKAFYILCLGFLIYLIIWLILKYKVKSLRVIIPLVVILALVVLIDRPLFVKMIKRFTYGEDTKSLINRITTGRSAIWYAYMEAIYASVPKMLFGYGLIAPDVIDIGSHSVILHILYRVGFVEVILFGVLIYLYIKEAKPKWSFNYSKILPLLTYLVISIEEQIFDGINVWFLFFGIILFFARHSEIEKKSTDDFGYNKMTEYLKKDFKH